MRSLRLLCFAFTLLVSHGDASAIVRRASDNKCTDLHAASNNGDRKIAIVIDSSVSMLDSDPTDLRIAAASNLIDGWLIPKSKATDKKPADLVTVIDFSEGANLDYALGDPGAANASLSKIQITGGTVIASGVEMAISQLTGSSSGPTDKRSGIVVLTDGEDTDTPSLVEQINKASGMGIRVSFGFLSAYSSYQDADVLSAIMRSGGRYYTMYSATTANTFVNLVLVNGLTENDNPGGSDSQLLGGLSVSRFISGSDTVTVEYDAREHEVIDFTVESIDAGSLSAQASLNGKVVDKTTTGYSSGSLIVSAKNGGKVEIKVQANSAPKDSIFTVGATSNLPTQNCTVGVGKPSSGLSPPAQGGLAVSLIALFAGLSGCCYYLWKKKYSKPKPKLPPGDHAEPKLLGDQSTSNLTMDAKTDPSIHTYPLDSHPPPLQLYSPPPQATLAVPPYVPPKKAGPPKDQNQTAQDTPRDQNGTSDQPNQPSNATGDQPPNTTSDQPPQTNNPSGDNPTSDSNNPTQPPDLPHDHDPDLSDFSISGSDSDDSHKKHRRRRYKTRKDKCGCLQCPHCFDCGSRCTPDCNTTASTEGITGGRICGLDCRVYCAHDEKYDCSAKKAHKKHRHRCHRCREHNDAEGEGKHEVCPCRNCESCTDCTTDCGPGGCPGTDAALAGNGHVHVRHRCKEHSHSWM